MKIFYWLFLPFVLVACTHNPIPSDYNGPIAYFEDTFSNNDGSSAHYFELIAINDKQIESSYGATRSRYQGMGQHFDPVMLKRPIMAVEQRLTIRATRFYPTDGQLLFGDNQSVEKTFVFKPLKDETYFVKGKLLASGSKVWLVDSAGKKVDESL